MYGLGNMKYSNGDIYFGDWVDNIRNGMGEIKFSDGREYEG